MPLALLGLSTFADGCSSKPDANALAADAASAAASPDRQEPAPARRGRRRRSGRPARDAAAVPTIQLGALFLETPIMSDMEWRKKDEDKRPGEKDRVVRIGYLRRGARGRRLSRGAPQVQLRRGLVRARRDGGFVCGKYATTDMNHPTLRLSPHLPDMNAALPYQYGYNMTNGTPLYRTHPLARGAGQARALARRPPQAEDRSRATTTTTTTSSTRASRRPSPARA